jgi:hypothetical protein
MIVTDMPVESLVPYARNPRNNTAAVDAVKASIAEFGFRQPIVVDEKMVVIVGHTRLEAAKALGLSVAGVDLLRSENGPVVLEVNVSPGLQGIEQHPGEPGGVRNALQPRLGERRDLVPLESITETLLPLFESFKSQREGKESFGDYCARLGLEKLLAIA